MLRPMEVVPRASGPWQKRQDPRNTCWPWLTTSSVSGSGFRFFPASNGMTTSLAALATEVSSREGFLSAVQPESKAASIAPITASSFMAGSLLAKICMFHLLLLRCAGSRATGVNESHYEQCESDHWSLVISIFRRWAIRPTRNHRTEVPTLRGGEAWGNLSHDVAKLKKLR